jgi:hypothetical protein
MNDPDYWQLYMVSIANDYVAVWRIEPLRLFPVQVTSFFVYEIVNHEFHLNEGLLGT